MGGSFPPSHARIRLIEKNKHIHIYDFREERHTSNSSLGTARKRKGARVAWDAVYCRIICIEHVLRTMEQEDNT